MKHTILSFIKFGEEEHIRDLYENGTIYMNPIEFFRKKEDQELRGDSYEGASRIINSLPGTFKIPGIDREFRYESVHLTESYETVLGNLFCLYCISSFTFPDPKSFKVDELNHRFGTHCLLIKDVNYFFHRIQEVMKTSLLVYHHGFVKYYDRKKVNKALSLFDKPSEFAYQKEFRFYVDSRKTTPIEIQIGSLKGKADLCTMEDINTLKLVKK